MSTTRARGAGRGTGGVLLTLAAGQFLMTGLTAAAGRLRDRRAGLPAGRGHLQSALATAGASPEVTAAALDINSAARVDGLRSALAVLALVALLGLFVARRIPRRYSPQTGDPP